MRQKGNHRCVFAFQVEEINKWTCNSNWRTIKHLWGAHQEKLRLSCRAPHRASLLLDCLVFLLTPSLALVVQLCPVGDEEDGCGKGLCVWSDTHKPAGVCVCVCMCLWVHMHQSSTNPIREMLHGNGPQRDTVMYTHVSSVFVCVEKRSETKTETVCICVHVWVFWAICVHCTGRPWAGSALEWGSASHLTVFVHTLPVEQKKQMHSVCLSETQ